MVDFLCFVGGSGGGIFDEVLVFCAEAVEGKLEDFAVCTAQGDGVALEVFEGGLDFLAGGAFEATELCGEGESAGKCGGDEDLRDHGGSIIGWGKGSIREFVFVGGDDA